MPLLGALLVSLFSGLADVLVKFLSRKVAMAAAAVTLFGTITTACYVGVRSAMSALATAIPGGYFATGLSIGVPDNGPACVAAIVGVWVGCTLYVWQAKAVNLWATTQ